MQMSEIDAKIRHFEQVLNVTGVRIINLDIRAQNSKDDFSSGAGSDVGIPAFANNVRDRRLRRAQNPRESRFAIVSEVPIDSPRPPVIGGLFHYHTRRTKRLERHDEMREMKLCL